MTYPSSFPNETEIDFLRLALCDDVAFASRFDLWSRRIVLDDVDYATMRLLPLVYLRTASLGIAGPNHGRLQGVYKLAWVQNQRLLGSLDRVAATSERIGVRMLALKGVPLLALAYKNVGARFLGDADVLIDRHDIKKTIAAMVSDGWTVASDAFPDVAYFSDEQIARITKECCFRDAHGVEIDVHWRLFDATGDDDAVPFDRWWTESLPFSFRGREYRSLSPEDMLLNVIVHGAAHNAHRTLRWVTDAAAIVRSFDVDWDRFVRIAIESRRAIEVRTAVAFLEGHEFLSVPDSVRAFVTMDSTSDAERAAYEIRSNGAHDAFVGFRTLWRAYWRHEAAGSFLGRAWRFIAYVRHARGLENSRELAAYAWGWWKMEVRR
ncbi:MAG: hypothetical protein EBT21_06410 [Actinobacteria bacterium]|nr:hypothetical protein [Actinomycetota bacterium]